MDLQKRQRLGYLTAALVVLLVAFSVAGGYIAGYYNVAGANPVTPPRPLPKDVCSVLSKSTQLRLVPSGVAVRPRVTQDGTTKTTASCGLATGTRNAITYNEGRLSIQVDRYGGGTASDRTRAAEQAMTEILNRADPAGEADKKLGELSWVTLEKVGANTWRARVFAQQEDTVAGIDYTTWLGNGRDTRKAAVAVTNELLAGLT
ncbi:MAG: hypothetical protein GEV07_22775 [Streptosporangiales bacterium]|nr:hypothetical protein [Streptosporangiales bacterium]